MSSPSNAIVVMEHLDEPATMDKRLHEATRTHYIPFFTRDGEKGTHEAACTAFVDPSCHSTEPSCWGCQAWLADDAEAVKKLREAEHR